MSRDDGSVLGRWSRRKRAAAVASEPDASSPAPAASAEDLNGNDEDLTEPELLEKLGLPDPDTLRPGDDFKAFMAKHVPGHLRQRALRRLWASNPVLANVDGLVDYGGDFTDAATVPEVLATAYQVGKGFLQKPAETDPETDAPAEAMADAPQTAGAVPDPAAEQPQETPGATAEAPQQEDPPPPRPRRMAFRTD